MQDTSHYHQLVDDIKRKTCKVQLTRLDPNHIMSHQVEVPNNVAGPAPPPPEIPPPVNNPFFNQPNFRMGILNIVLCYICLQSTEHNVEPVGCKNCQTWTCFKCAIRLKACPQCRSRKGWKEMK